MQIRFHDDDDDDDVILLGMLANVAKRYFRVCNVPPSVRPPACISLAVNGMIFFLGNLVERIFSKSKIGQNRTKVSGTSREDLSTFIWLTAT